MRFGRVIALVLLPVVLSACGGAEPSHPLATAPAAPILEPSAPPAPRFVNTAPDAGLTALLYCGGVSKDHLLESTGTGAALIDYDGDGRLDAFLVNAWALDEEPSRVRVKGRNFLYHNMGGGRFEDVTDRAGVGGDGWGGGVCAGDYDDDGRIFSSPASVDAGYTGTGETGLSSKSPTAPASPARGGRPVRHSSTPTATATWISMSPTTSTPRLTRSWRHAGRRPGAKRSK
jgi:hypothetical protein